MGLTRSFDTCSKVDTFVKVMGLLLFTSRLLCLMDAFVVFHPNTCREGEAEGEADIAILG